MAEVTSRHNLGREPQSCNWNCEIFAFAKRASKNPRKMAFSHMKSCQVNWLFIRICAVSLQLRDLMGPRGGKLKALLSCIQDKKSGHTTSRKSKGHTLNSVYSSTYPFSLDLPNPPKKFSVRPSRKWPMMRTIQCFIRVALPLDMRGRGPPLCPSLIPSIECKCSVTVITLRLLPEDVANSWLLLRSKAIRLPRSGSSLVICCT